MSNLLRLSYDAVVLYAFGDNLMIETTKAEVSPPASPLPGLLPVLTQGGLGVTRSTLTMQD